MPLLAGYIGIGEYMNTQKDTAVSKYQKGKAFEKEIHRFLEQKGIDVEEQPKITIGIKAKKEHAFDLGNEKFLVECKTDKWRNENDVPSGKLAEWAKAMFDFYLAPKKYAKYFFAKKEYSPKKGKTLLEHFIDCYNYLIPSDVVLIDYNTENQSTDVYVYDEDKMQHIKTAKFVF